ncbi:MAG: Tim44 domain-containing protein [Desulfobulbaceae bacterium]|jgi:predicted lipid-binding transport protein (Tim44 family)|nr:Tim44 domain-containing protein [Desulfobulbaceae bacterium]
MRIMARHFGPFCLIFFAFLLFDMSCLVNNADARSRGGGRSFSRSRTTTRPTQTTRPRTNRGSFGRGLAGGLVGGAIGSMLFGSMFGGAGMGGSGIGLLQILIFGGLFFFIFKKINPGVKRRDPAGQQSVYGQYDAPVETPLEQGIAELRQSDPDFDPKYFSEVAQDVFFKVQAGWMRRDISSYKHLLGDTLIREYEDQFATMIKEGHLNKLENVAVRKADVVEAGVDGGDEFVLVNFEANLLDYTVDETSGDVVKGSMTEPVKFNENWTWARAIGASNWKLEGIEVLTG